MQKVKRKLEPNHFRGYLERETMPILPAEKLWKLRRVEREMAAMPWMERYIERHPPMKAAAVTPFLILGGVGLLAGFIALMISYLKKERS